MRALIFPFQQAGGLAPFRALCPDFLLPLAGKPIVEHLLEQLVTAGIYDVTLLCDDRPEEAVQHYGNGERWGCSLTISAVRDQGGLQRMLRAALHGVEGAVVCLAGNLAVSEALARFLIENTAQDKPYGILPDTSRTAFITGAATLLKLVEEDRFETMDELLAAAGRKGLLSPVPGPSVGLLAITTPTGFLQVQRDILEERISGSRIPARRLEPGIWIGSHTTIDAGIRLEAPLLIGSHCRISGKGQIGPNAVIFPYCLINNTDLISDSLVLTGTATGAHTELNGMAARGGVLVNLRSGVTVNAPDAFILGDVGATHGRSSTGVIASLVSACLLLGLAPLGVPFLLLSMIIPGLSRNQELLGNKRTKTLTGEHPRTPFTLREFTFGPLLLRRWPGLFAVLSGNLTLVGACANSTADPGQAETDPVFGLDVPRGLFHIWEVEGELPESAVERHARENFHDVTRTVNADLAVVLKAALTFPS